MQERGLSPCLGDGVTFRISTHLATAKAAEKSDAAAAKHAGAHRQGRVIKASSCNFTCIVRGGVALSII